MKPLNVIQRADLTTYAFGLSQDMAEIQRIANVFAPVVPTGGTTGRYNKFDTTQSFKNYAESARRAIGGHANVIGFLSETADYNADPYGLRINIDSAERQRAGTMLNLLEQAKVRTLTVNCLLAHLMDVVTVVKAGVSAVANKGAWNNANVDPIAEINQQIKAIWKATGVVPNTVAFDFGAWCVFSDNPNVRNRMPGADLAVVSPERVQKLFVNPSARVEVVNPGVLTGGGLGNAAASVQGVLGGSVFVFFNSAVPTQYDPSFCKTFAPTAQLFTEVYQYREEPHFDWYENDWTGKPTLVSNLLCKRIDVTGAND